MTDVSQSDARLQVQGLCKSYGVGAQRSEVLQNVSFDARRGEIVALLGASGCGKTTLLNILAGFLSADAGTVLVQGSPTSKAGPDKAVVFQEDALFPWLNVFENIAFGLKIRATPEKQIRAVVARMLTLVGLSGNETRMPRELSGGMRQRVALARVLALKPGLLLLDEPFAALDALTREEMHDLLLTLHAQFSPTTVFVTHDVVEAVKLADCVLIMGQKTIHSQFRIASPRPRETETHLFIDHVRAIRRVLRQVYPASPLQHT